MSLRAAKPALRPLAALALLLTLSSCTLVSAAWDSVFGGGGEPSEMRTEKETDMAVLHELVHRNGQFHPEMVLEPNDVEPLQKVPDTYPSAASDLPAAPPGATQDQRMVAFAHNPPSRQVTPTPAAVQHAGVLDFAFELGVIAALASLLAGVVVMAIRRPAILALLISVLALVLAAMALM